MAQDNEMKGFTPAQLLEMWNAGLITRREFRLGIDLSASDEDDVYKIPDGYRVVPAGDPLRENGL